MVILDLFCGAGGASMGLSRAGFEVEGVDIEPQPNYPFKFYQSNSLTFPLEQYDAYWASPPCQAYISKGRATGEYQDLIGWARARLCSTTKPYVIENIMPAPLRKGLVLCGVMFNLKVIRHRGFESNVLLWQLPHEPHRGRVKRFRNDSGIYFACNGHEVGTAKEWGDAMAIDWMTKTELAQAVPPAYTEYIGKFLLELLNKPISYKGV